MTDKILSLSRARKARDKVKKRLQSDENVVKFGLTKSQRTLDAAQSKIAKASLDAHKQET